MAEEQNQTYVDPNIKRYDFPSDFMFGVASSAYQIEGAWNEGGKGLHGWDCLSLRHREAITDGSNGCVAVDHYHRVKEDVRLLKQMGVTHYRFSISWARILPGGTVSMGKNLEGINHYNKLIDELIANGIEPFVTLFHWDLPTALEEQYMGFLSSRIVDDFVNYAEICFWEFGDRVKNWLTINEPYIFTNGSYIGANVVVEIGENLLHESDTQTVPYIAAYNLLNCHAAAYRKYQEDFKDVQKGQVGITLDATYFKPFHGKDSKDDLRAVEYAYDFTLGWFMEPLTSGNWPKNMQKFATAPSIDHPEGRKLPEFTEDQKKKLIQSYDFLGINYYTANYAQLRYHFTDLSNGFHDDSHFTKSGTDYNGKYIGEPAFEGSWVYLCPNELFLLLQYIKETYKFDKYIIITENGAPQKNDDKQTYVQVRDDPFRLKYLKLHLDAIKRANIVSENSTNKPLVKGYYAWSFTDSYEWYSGYTIRFGMNFVDYKNNLHRYPKNSAIWFKKFLSENKVSEPRKKRLVDVEQEDEVVNGAPKKVEQPIEVIQKLKKAKT